jgi:putative LysE/RhtB family amino acid efflux pump
MREPAMEQVSLFMSGGLIGLSIAAPIGPMGMLCINRTLASGLTIGISTGAGATTVHVLYCAIILLGLQQVGPWLSENHAVLGVAGGLLMLFFAWRLVRRRPVAREATAPRARSILAAYASAVVFNLSNPLTLVLMTGALASVIGGRPPSPQQVVMLLAGLLAGSLTWFVCLSAGTAALHRRFSDAVRWVVNQAAAAVLVGFGILSLARALRG